MDKKIEITLEENKYYAKNCPLCGHDQNRITDTTMSTDLKAPLGDGKYGTRQIIIMSKNCPSCGFKWEECYTFSYNRFSRHFKDT